MIHYTSQRVAILIDTANIYHTAKAVYRSKVHFENMINLIAQGRSVSRVIAYAITSEEATEASFLETLSSAGIQVKTKPLITYRQGTQKADWDVGIAVEAIAIAPHVDTIIIVSGDGDFAPLMRHLRSMGVRAEVASFDQSFSNLLVDSIDFYHDLSKSSNSILINRHNPFMSNAKNSKDTTNKLNDTPSKLKDTEKSNEVRHIKVKEKTTEPDKQTANTKVNQASTEKKTKTKRRRPAKKKAESK